MNVVILRGRLARPVESRTLPSGVTLATYDLVIERPGERPETVPVVWNDAPVQAYELESGTEVVVVGRVRRRFFRSSGATQSRTEVVAEEVVPARLVKRSERLVTDALARAGIAPSAQGAKRSMAGAAP